MCFRKIRPVAIWRILILREKMKAREAKGFSASHSECDQAGTRRDGKGTKTAFLVEEFP